MGVIDVFILIAVVAGLIWGAVKGAVNQISSMAGFVLGIILARVLGPFVAKFFMFIVPALAESESSKDIASILGHVTVFILVFLSISIIANVTKFVVKNLKLGVFDKIGGSIFCALKFLMALSLLLNLWLITDSGNSVFRGKKMMDGKPFKFTMSLAPWLLDVAEEQCDTAMDQIEKEMVSIQKEQIKKAIQ